MYSRPAKPVITLITVGKRAYFRAPVRLAVTGLAWGRRRPVFGRVDNLSVGGMHVICADAPPAETPCLFRLQTDGDAGETAFVTGWVAHNRGGGMGVQFDAMAPGVEEVIRRMINRKRKCPSGRPADSPTVLFSRKGESPKRKLAAA